MFFRQPWTLSARPLRSKLAPFMLSAGVTAFSWLAPNALGQKTDDWTDSTGEKTVVAEFVKLEGVNLTLRKGDGKEIVLPLNKLDNKSRLKARAMAKNGGDSPSSSTDESTTGSDSSSTKSSEPVSFPSNPTSQEFMDIVLRELNKNHSVVLWDALPASKQRKVEELVKLASTRIEQKTLNLIKKFRGELLTTLKGKKQFILNSKALPIPPEQRKMLIQSYDPIVDMIETVFPAEWLDARYLQKTSPRELLSGYIDNLASRATALQRSLPSDSPFQAMLRPVPQSARAEDISTRETMVTFDLPGVPSNPAKFVLNEGRWLPEAMLANWEGSMADATGVLKDANPTTIYTQVGGTLVVANGLLGAISTAETQEEFDELIEELMSRASMNGGMPALGFGF